MVMATTATPSSGELAPEAVEKRLRAANLFAARLQLLVSSALVWLIFIFGAISGGIPPAIPTLLLGAWIIGSTLWLSLLALRAHPGYLVGHAPGRLSLAVTLVTAILATLLIRDTQGDFYLVYLFPIAVATIYYGVRGGFVAAVFCALSYIFLGLFVHQAVLTADFITVLIERIVLLFALAGSIGVAAEGQLALIGELKRAYADLKTATQNLQETQWALKRRIQEDAMLDEVARQITSTLEPDQVLSRVLERVETLLDAEASTLMTLDPLTEELVFQIPRGSSADALRGYRLPRGQGVAGWVALYKQPLRVDDASKDPRHSPSANEQTGFQTRSLLAVPMVLQERVTGVLEVINKRQGCFTAEDERLLGAVAQWAAIALENARLYHELQESLEQLQHAQEQLVRNERLRVLGEMAGGIAHDFNNLLTIILAESQLLAAKATDREERQSLERIEQAARDGAQAVRRIQEYSRIRRDAPQEVVEVNKLLQEVVALTRPRWSPIGTVQLDLHDVAPIRGSPGELREVLINLLFNALEARRGNVPCTVILRSRFEEAGWVVIEVEDNGVGIPPELRQRIFDPYFTTKPHGTGLGLSVAYGLIARHGGEIQVLSPLAHDGAEMPYGTRFVIRLPALQPDAKESEKMTQPLAMPSVARILFVDDDPNILAAARSLLSALGSRVTTAQSYSEAKEHVERGEYDVMMTDLTLPDCSGWDLVKRSKQLHPHKPVVLVTGWGLTLDPHQLRSGLTDGLLSKPFTLDELKKTLSEVEAKQAMR